MYPTRPVGFSYHRASSVDEAVSLLGRLEGARPLAGGHSLLPAMKLRLTSPAALIDIGRIPGLNAIEHRGDGLRIGALATHADVADSDVIRGACPVLAEAAGLIGDRQVRNRGTIGGSLAHADPGADYPTVVKALEASIATSGPGGQRFVRADEFFTGIFTTALQPGELVTHVHVPTLPAGSGSVYLKHKHPASGYAVAAVAAVVTVEGGTCSRARIIVGGVTATPTDATAVAGALVGSAPSDEAVAAVAAKIPDALGDSFGDAYASAEYRVHLAGVLAGRALNAAFERAAA